MPASERRSDRSLARRDARASLATLAATLDANGSHWRIDGVIASPAIVAFGRAKANL
jgi:hypothetical protein